MPTRLSPTRHRGGSRRAVLIVLCAGYFLVLLDVTIINVALPQIGAQLGAGVEGLQWVVDGYALVLAALLLTGGTLGDLRGHKRLVLVGCAIFTVTSAAAGLAPNIAALVAARVGQGFGAALLLPGTLAIITRVFPGRAEQARAIGIWTGVGSVALPVGPLLGGLLVDSLGWRAVFFLNVPIVVVAAAAVARLVRESRGDPRHLDVTGLVAGSVFLAALTFAVIDVGAHGLAPAAVVAFLVAIGSLAAFVLVERSSPDPVVPLALFARPAFSTVNAVSALMNLGNLGLLFVLTQYLQVVQHRSAIAAGLAVLPLFVPLAGLAPVAGRLTARRGPRPLMVLGLLIGAVGVGLLALLQPDSRYLVLLPALLAWGAGMGLLTPAAVAAAVSTLGPDRAGTASGLNNTARQVGGIIGIAAYGGIAGSTLDADRFVAGFRATGLLTAAIFVVATVATLLLVPRRRPA